MPDRTSAGGYRHAYPKRILKTPPYTENLNFNPAETLEELVPVALAISNKYSRRYSWFRQDIKALALLGLVRGFNDPVYATHPEPLAYLRARITAQIRNALKKERINKKHTMLAAPERPKYQEDSRPDLYDEWDVIVNSGLTREEQRILVLRVDGLKLDEICKILHRSKRDISRSLQEIAKKIKDSI